MSRSDDSFVAYGIEDRPPLGTSLLLGVQHYLTMVGANIAVPLILAGALGMPAEIIPRFVGTFFVISGVATLAQTTFGNRYPIVQGAPFSMLAPALAVVGVVTASDPAGPAWQAALLQLQGAILVAALAEIAVGYFGLLGKLRSFLSPVVIAPTIALIGLSLFNTPQVTAATTNVPLLALTLLLIVLFSQYIDTAHRVFGLFPVLLGIVVAYGIAAVLSAVGVYAPDTSGYVDFGTVLSAPAFVPIYPLQWGFAGGPNSVTVAFPLLGEVAFGVPQVTSAFVVGMLAGVGASMIESLGDYHAVARLSGIGAPSEKRINHGIGMEGLMNVFSALMGGSGSTSYSENIGAIGLTGVASRYVVQIGAAVMLVVGFVGYFGQLVATIPDPVVGGLYIAMFGQIVAVGLSNLKYVDLDSSRNIFVVGVSLFVGLAVPTYMANVGSAGAFQEGMRGVAYLGPILGAQVVSNTVFVIGSTGMAVGGLFAFVLDNTIEGTREERGLEEWEESAEADEDFASAYDRFVRGGTKGD
ncbi:xanthine/uracil permease [Halogeometricum pallidum JCM 14848]|uniref:Xanthine/uracil permease n=1 Tax=Halogeometricum pallidum JCM 14848 TaxID=1227487 RepID=M0CSN8_HALPD|nr:solute carrier family 23 protein [Halogeometricum pallidum]ELZ26226.1 xanthine/uracil permease [Halogeometricum pallidum JCM 14848]